MTLPVEIERRFRVNLERLAPGGEDGKPMPPGRYYKQAYLAVGDPTIRVRIIGSNHQPIYEPMEVRKAELTAKGRGTVKRTELNVALQPADALHLIDMATYGSVEKVRYEITVRATPWVIDRFVGRHEGLWLAEVELPSVDAPFVRPPWLGEEVTEDPHFTNAHLAGLVGNWRDGARTTVNPTRCIQCLSAENASTTLFGSICAVVCTCGYRVAGETTSAAIENWNRIARMVGFRAAGWYGPPMNVIIGLSESADLAAVRDSLFIAGLRDINVLGAVRAATGILPSSVPLDTLRSIDGVVSVERRRDVGTQATLASEKNANEI